MNRLILISLLFVLVIPAWAFAKAAPCSTSGGGSGLCYVDNSCTHNGNGTCNGTAPSCTCASTGDGAGPFNSITNMQADTYTGGDEILLKAEDTFYEQLIIPSSGNSTNPIIFGSYGTGNKPVISGLSNNGATLSGFTVYSGNVWQIALTTQPYGLIINTLSGANSLTPLPPAASLSTVAAPGNWFWASKVLYVYSVETPDGTVLAPMRSHVVELNGQSYITLNGLTITGANGPVSWSGAVDRTTALYPNYIHIINCNITQSFGVGVRIIESSNDVFDSNTFSYLYEGEIELDNYSGGTSIQVQFSNNVMHDIYGPGFNTYGDGSIVAPFSNFSIP
ncbi:MAG: right-handed parallel beta-helix repeat-containing protein [Syntrophobacteraceae bacterium]